MLDEINCFLLDMDGTIYLGDKLLPGAVDFLDLLKERDVNYLFLTNNSSKNANQYVKKLAKLDIHVNEDQILTSGEATAMYLKREHQQASIFVVGTTLLKEVFRRYDFKLVKEDPDIVVLGFDTTLTYEKLWKCCNYIRNGLPYIATHPDINCPTEDGFMPDIGSFIALIESSTGRLPDLVIGKPNREMVQAILDWTGLKKDQIAMIGDRLYTDIALGKSGIKTILVLSGEAKLSDLASAEVKPDHIMKDLSELVELMK